MEDMPVDGAGWEPPSVPGPASAAPGLDPEPPSTMLEHPIFVHWCVSCGQEVAEDAARSCPRCGDRVERHQRVLELPDEDEGLLSLRSLRAALADVSVGEDLTSCAVMLSEQGADPDVAAMYPTFALQLVQLGVPPAIQRALVSRGFVSLEQICASVTSAPDPAALAVELGLSPAAEVLLRRLWHVALEMRTDKRAAPHRSSQSEKRLSRWSSSLLSCGPCIAADASSGTTLARSTDARAKRLRPFHLSIAEGAVDEEIDEVWPLSLDDQMQGSQENEAELA